MVEMVEDALDVAHAVAVRIGERAHVDLVENPITPPRWSAHLAEEGSNPRHPPSRAAGRASPSIADRTKAVTSSEGPRARPRERMPGQGARRAIPRRKQRTSGKVGTAGEDSGGRGPPNLATQGFGQGAVPASHTDATEATANNRSRYLRIRALIGSSPFRLPRLEVQGKPMDCLYANPAVHGVAADRGGLQGRPEDADAACTDGYTLCKWVIVRPR
jgi:hypothetical protein